MSHTNKVSPQPPIPDSSFQGAVMIASFIASAALIRYFGSSAMVPLFGAPILYLILRGVAPNAKPFHAAIAIQAVHLLWMLVGMMAMPEMALLMMVDVVCLSVGLVWLLARPQLAAVLFLSAYQLLACASSAVNYAALNSSQQRVLQLHLLMRGAAVILMIHGARARRRAPARIVIESERRQPTEASSDVVPEPGESGG